MFIDAGLRRRGGKRSSVQDPPRETCSCGTGSDAQVGAGSACLLRSGALAGSLEIPHASDRSGRRVVALSPGLLFSSPWRAPARSCRSACPPPHSTDATSTQCRTLEDARTGCHGSAGTARPANAGPRARPRNATGREATLAVTLREAMRDWTSEDTLSRLEGPAKRRDMRLDVSFPAASNSRLNATLKTLRGLFGWDTDTSRRDAKLTDATRRTTTR